MLRWRHAVVRDGLTTRRRPAAAALRAVLHRMAQTHQRCMSFVTALSGWHRRAESDVAHWLLQDLARKDVQRQRWLTQDPQLRAQLQYALIQVRTPA